MKLKFDKEPESSGFSVGKVAGARGVKYRTTFANGGTMMPQKQIPMSPTAPTMMAKGGAIKGKKPAAALAIMIAMPAKGKGKTKMAMGGCATKKK